MSELPQISTRLHSYYLRSPVDLVVSGQTVRLKLRAPLSLPESAAQQQTLAERFPATLAAHTQRTHRLTALLTLFALALSGRAGERLLATFGAKGSLAPIYLTGTTL